MPTIDVQVGASADDAEEKVSDGTMNLTNPYIRLGNHTFAADCGFRFQAVDVPKDATIITAYMSHRAYSQDVQAVSFTWYGEDVDSSTTFTSDNYNISGRDKTIASVTENPPPTWTKNAWIDGPEIKTIIAEITSRAGWVANNHLTILCIYNSGTGERLSSAWGWDGFAAKLHIEYTVGAAYHHGLKVQSVGELALCDVGNHPLRMRKGGTTYGLELVAVDDPNASRVRIETGAGLKAIRKYT